jgi:HEPN domain-containing protein
VAQQAAEKAVGALHRFLGSEVWGHSVSRLLEQLPENYRAPKDLIDKAKELDRHYGPTRYPNFHSEGAPSDYYTRDDAERAIKYARMVIEFVRSKVFKLDYEEILGRLREYAKRKLSDNVLAILLIGSLARGDYTAFSDADIVVIVKSDVRRFIDRIPEYIDTDLGIDIDPRVYTLDEILKMCRERRKLIKEIIDYGILLAGDQRILDRLRECI